MPHLFKEFFSGGDVFLTSGTFRIYNHSGKDGDTSSVNRQAFSISTPEDAMSKKKRNRQQTVYDPRYDEYVEDIQSDLQRTTPIPRESARRIRSRDDESLRDEDFSEIQEEIRRRASKRLASLDALRGINFRSQKRQNDKNSAQYHSFRLKQK